MKIYFSRYRTELLLTLLVALFSLPFIGQALHIDDRLYLEVAEQALENPGFPYDHPLLFEGLWVPDGASHSHLPLTVYYMAFIKLITGGEQEWIFHFFFMVFPLIAAFSFHDLAGRYIRRPLFAVFLLLSAPVFLTLGHNLMTDVPMLAFWLLALSSYMKLLSGEGSKTDMMLLGLALLCSAFLSLLTMGLIILLVSGLVIRRIPGIGSGSMTREKTVSHRTRNKYFPPAWAWWLVLLLPILLWAFWYGRAWFHYDRLVLINTFMHMDQRETLDLALLATKLLSFVLNIGALFCFPLIVWICPKKKSEWLLSALILVVSLLSPFIFLSEWALVHQLLFSLFLSTGLLLFAEILRKAAAPTVENLLLVFWFLGILLTGLLLFYSGSARYVLLALPPSILVVTAKIESRFPKGPLPFLISALMVACTLFYSVPISYTDYEFAKAYQVNAEKICGKYKAEGKNIWFTGEWGFRHYMTENGALVIPRNSADAKVGDFIIKPYIASPWVTLYDGDGHSRLVEQIPLRTSLPLRILDFSSHAGFYSSGWGLLPISWTSGRHYEWFNIYEVTRKYSGPVPEGEKHW
jgi:Dolichyl-phosphate-mannose-protein mannosyltransferase